MAEENNTSEGATGATENPETVSTSDVLATLKHDPFPGGEAPKEGKGTSSSGAKPKAKATTAGKDAKASSGTDGKSADGSTDGTQPAQPDASSDPEKTLLKDSLKHANDLLDAYKSRGSQPERTAGKSAPSGDDRTGEGDETTPKYNFNIPDSLVSALGSEDPAVVKQGLAGMATGVALGVHQQMVAQLPKIIEGMMAQIVPKYVQPALETYNSRKSIFDDFYGTYKELNNPKLYPLIAQVTQEVMGEAKTDKWSPNVRDAVANRVKGFLKTIVGSAVPPLREDAADALAGKKGNGSTGHPAMFGGNNSRVSNSGQDNLEKEIADTLFLGD